jgi:hypothetical protein
MKTPKRNRSPQPRAHRVLFDRNLPFRSRTEQNRVLYQRNIKHRAQLLAD